MPENIYDQVTIKNVDTDPFEIIYGGESYGVLQPGDARTYPRFLAEHALTHLIDQILNRQNLLTSNKVARSEWASKIVLSQKPLAGEVEKSEHLKLKEEIAKMNDATDLQLLEKARKVEELENNIKLDATPSLETAPIAPVPVVLPQVAPVDPPKSTGSPTLVPEAKPAEPTREQLMDHARNVLKMNLDDVKTKASLDAMTVEDLKTAVQWGE